MAETIPNKVSRLCNLYYRMSNPPPYQIEANPPVTYTRWSTDNTNAIFIQRVIVSVSGTITTTRTEFAFDTWARRTVAHYYYEFE